MTQFSLLVFNETTEKSHETSYQENEYEKCPKPLNVIIAKQGRREEARCMPYV